MPKWKNDFSRNSKKMSNYIFNAVKSHQALLSSLKSIQKMLLQEDGTPEAKSTFAMCERIKDEVEKAIALAEEGK